MLESPSLGWQKLHNVFYSLNICYDSLNWSVESLYSNHIFSISSNTTLIALASNSGPYPNVIDVYSLSGNKLWSVVFNSLPLEHIVDFCFHGEQLVVVLSSRKYRLYTDFYGTFNEYDFTQNLQVLDTGSAGTEPKEKFVITNLENNETEEPFDVLEAVNWGQFLVLRHRTRITVVDLLSHRNYDLNVATVLDPSLINCITEVSTSATSIEFLLSYKETIFVVNVDLPAMSVDYQNQSLTDGPFTQIAVSANSSLFAIFNDRSSKIYIITKEFNRILLDYDTSNESSNPYMIQWAANDAIVLSLRDEIKLVGPHQEAVSFFYDLMEQDEFNPPRDNSFSFIVPIIKSEPDGLKIITPNKVEFLARVPSSLINLHQVGSNHPSAVLLSCVEKLEIQSYKADTNISLLKSDNTLRTAMESCLDAALHEFSILWQKRILKAVSFGKIYDDDLYNANHYLHVLNTLRVLDELRSMEVGLFLTIDEITAIGWKTVIEMLLNRRLHQLAISVIDILELKNLKNLVYVHWCCCKIRKELNMDDVELFNIVAKKLVSAEKPTKKSQTVARNFIPVSEIAEVALQEGRTDLCKMVINLEPSILERVSQFLAIGDSELALLKAFQAGDSDLCNLLLKHLFDTLSKTQFFQIISHNELRTIVPDSKAGKLEDNLTVYFQENLFINGDLMGNFWAHSIAKSNPKLYESYLKHEDKYTERALSKMKLVISERHSQSESFDYEDVYQRQKSKIQLLGKDPALASVVQQEIAVLDLKRKLSDTYQQSFFDLSSLNDILEKLIGLHQLKPAAKVCKDFRISTERFWNLLIEKYCQLGEFERLQVQLIPHQNKTGLPELLIPLDKVAQTYIAYDAPKNFTSELIANASDISYFEKAELLIKVDHLEAAAREALNNKDRALLLRISRLSKNLQTTNAINAMINQI